MAETKVIITAEDRTKAALDSATKGFDKYAGGLASQMKYLAGPAGIGALVAGFAVLVKSQVEVGDQLNKLSQKTGAAVETLSAYQYAAKLSDVSNEDLSTGLVKLAKNIQEAAINKGGEAARMFEALGISVTQADGKLRPVSQVMEDISRKFSGAADSTEKTTAAVTLLGRSGANLIPLLNNLESLVAEAERAGVIVSTKFAQQAEQFNDSASRMSASASTLGRTIASFLIPEINEAIEQMNIWIGAQDSFSVSALELQMSRLQKRLAEVNEEKKRGIIIGAFHKTGLGREEAELITRISKLDDELTAARNRANAARGQSGGAASGGGAALPTLKIPQANQSNEEKSFNETLQRMRKATAEANASTIEDEREKSEERIRIASEEFRQKVDFSKLSVDQRKEFEQELMAFQTAAEFAAEERILEKEEKELERSELKFEKLQAEFDAEYAMKEEQKEQMAILDEYYNTRGLEQDDVYQQMRIKIQAGGLSAMAKQVQAANKSRSMMYQAAFKGDLASMGGVLGEMSGLMNSESRKQFEIGKKAAKAKVLVDTYMAAQSGFATTPFFPLGIAMGAIALGIGMMNYQKVSGLQFEGGASPGGAVGTFPASPSTGLPEASAPPGGNLPQSQERESPRVVNLTVQGEGAPSDDYTRNVLIPALNNAVGDGVELNAMTA